MTDTNTDIPETEVTILSIDAWRDQYGWSWNQWYKVTTTPIGTCDMKPRKLFKHLRAIGVLGEGSKGRVAIEDDQYNLVIVEKNTRQPLYAIAYGEAQ